MANNKEWLDAIASGKPTYFTGQPCRRGHVSERYTKGGGCTACTKESNDRRLGTTRTKDRYPIMVYLVDPVADSAAIADYAATLNKFRLDQRKKD